MLTRRSRALAAAVALLGAACAAGLPNPTAADAERARNSYPDTSLAQLERGRDLYVRRCAACHTLKTPNELPRERWRGEVVEMRKKGVKLTHEETEAIVRYLEALSQRDYG